MAKVATVVHRYTNADQIVPPPSDDIAADCAGGRRAVASVVKTLRDKEVEVAKQF